MGIEIVAAAAGWALLLAPATIPVATCSLFLACLHLNLERWTTAPVPEPNLGEALAYGVAMAALPISAVGICFPLFQILSWLQIYHSTPAALWAATSTAFWGVGLAHASILSFILPVTFRQAWEIQQRVLVPLTAIFVPFWGASLL